MFTLRDRQQNLNNLSSIPPVTLGRIEEGSERGMRAKTGQRPNRKERQAGKGVREPEQGEASHFRGEISSLPMAMLCVVKLGEGKVKSKFV